MMGTWLLVLGSFMIVGWIATRVAHRTTSLPAQYAALSAYVLAEAIIFLPMLVVAQIATRGGVIESAALVTLLAFFGLTAVAFLSSTDFSFLGSVLKYAFVVALVLIVAASVFGFSLGTFFSVAMVALAGAPYPRHVKRYAATPRTATSARRSNCSPQSPSCSGTCFGCSRRPSGTEPRGSKPDYEARIVRRTPARPRGVRLKPPAITIAISGHGRGYDRNHNRGRQRSRRPCS
jgi:hypothetical protein